MARCDKCDAVEQNQLDRDGRWEALTLEQKREVCEAMWGDANGRLPAWWLQLNRRDPFDVERYGALHDRRNWNARPAMREAMLREHGMRDEWFQLVFGCVENQMVKEWGYLLPRSYAEECAREDLWWGEPLHPERELEEVTAR